MNNIYTNAFFIQHINIIGGVESFLYYLSKKYKNKDITIFYGTGDKKQIRRLQKYVRVIRHRKGDKIKCRRAYFQYGHYSIEDVEADEYIYIIHADYKTQGLQYVPHPKITRYFAVSETAQKGFKEAFDIDSEVVYNPLLLDTPKRILHLVSATRLTPEKGYDRMVTLANYFKRLDIPYKWDVYTYNDVNGTLFNKKNPTLNIIDAIADADYLVQLSDSEAYCYSVREALVVGTPCIVTDLPTFKEAGLENGKTGWLLPLDMKLDDETILSIYNDIPKLSYTDVKDNWGAILGRSKSTYVEELKNTVNLKAIQSFYDVEQERIVSRGEEFMALKERANALLKAKVVEVVND